MSGIGPVVAESVAEFFRQPQSRRLIKKLAAAGVAMTQPKREAGRRQLAGLTFVFTGEMADMSRSDAEAAVRRLGGRASSEVSRKTAYVVAGAAAGSKLERAKKLGVTIIDESAFKKLVAS